MEFNPDITKQATEVVFSCKRIKPNHPQLTFNGNALVKVNAVFQTRSVLTDFGLLTDFFCKSGLF